MILSIRVSETMGTGMGTMTWVQGTGTGTSPACQESRVRVQDQVRGYRYKPPYPDKYHDYGYGQGYYKFAKLSPLQLLLKNLATSFSMKEGLICRIS